MYNGNRYKRRTSIRGSGFSNGFSRLSSRSRFNRPRFSSNNRGGNQRRSQLEGADINMFIRKTTQIIPEELQNEAQNFEDFNLHEALKQNISILGYTKPTPVQSRSIGPILEGRDVIG